MSRDLRGARSPAFRHEDRLGLCPLADTMADGKARSSDVYLQHKDGHRVHVFVRAYNGPSPVSRYFPHGRPL